MLEELKLRVITTIGAWVIRLLRLTMRVEYIDFDKYGYLQRMKEGKQVILAFWHGRLLMMPYLPHRRGIRVLISMHRDGEIIARIVSHFGIRAVRGSTTRGSLSGVRGLLRALKEGGDIAITPDGPKGPAFKVQRGIIDIAKRTGLPIVPVSFSASKKKPLKAGMAS